MAHYKSVTKTYSTFLLFINKHRTNLILLLNIASFLALVITLTYTGWLSNLTASTDSDGLVNTYLFRDFMLQDMIVPGNHTIVMKWPLFAIQSIFTYNFLSYSLLNYALLFGTILGWLLGLTIIFGKKYFSIITILLVLLLLGSNTFSDLLIYGSLRNIEYPIGLFFIISLSVLLKKRQVTHKKALFLFLSALLLAFAIAGDSLMLISFIAPVIVITATYWIKGGSIDRRLVHVLAVVVVTVLISFLIKKIIAVTGLGILHYDEALKPVVIQFELFWPSLAYAFEQLFIVADSSISGRPISADQLLFFFKFAILCIGLIGIFVTVAAWVRKKPTEMLEMENFTQVTLALAFIATLASYVLLDFTYTLREDGELVSSGNLRYLELLPLILVGGVVSLYKLLPHSRQAATLGLFILGSIASIGLSVNTIKADYYNQQAEANNKISRQQKIGNVLKENNVQYFASGYWDGAATKFWTSEDIMYTSISSCNYTGPDFNTRKSWANNDTRYKTTALVVDRHDNSASYWLCTDEQITQIYGQPLKKVASDGTDESSIIWIYDYDIRTKFISPY